MKRKSWSPRKPWVAIFLSLIAMSGMAVSASAQSLDVAVLWGGTILDGFARAANRFEELHPGIEIQVRAVNDQAVQVAIAAGSPPDVRVGVNAGVIHAWAKQGMLQPLTPFIEKDEVIKQTTYIPIAWENATVDGEYYGLPLHPTGGIFFWNKRHFEEVAIDPDRAPRTIAELDDANLKLTRYNAENELLNAGVLPYEFYFYGNALTLWGLSFGWNGIWDSETKRYHLNQPALVEAAEWLRGHWERLPSSVTRNRLTGNNFSQWFANGNLSMAAGGPGLYSFVMDASDPFPVGISYVPSLTGEQRGPVAVWQGGVPNGAANPDLAYEFLRYLSADPEGSLLWAEGSGLVPSNLDSTMWDVMRRDQGPLYEMALVHATATVSEVQGPVEYRRPWMDEALARIFEGQSPQAVLQEAERALNAHATATLEQWSR